MTLGTIYATFIFSLNTIFSLSRCRYACELLEEMFTVLFAKLGQINIFYTYKNLRINWKKVSKGDVIF